MRTNILRVAFGETRVNRWKICAKFVCHRCHVSKRLWYNVNKYLQAWLLQDLIGKRNVWLPCVCLSHGGMGDNISFVRLLWNAETAFVQLSSAIVYGSERQIHWHHMTVMMLMKVLSHWKTSPACPLLCNLPTALGIVMSPTRLTRMALSSCCLHNLPPMKWTRHSGWLS